MPTRPCGRTYSTSSRQLKKQRGTALTKQYTRRIPQERPYAGEPTGDGPGTGTVAGAPRDRNRAEGGVQTRLSTVMPDLLETGPYRDRTIQRPDQARPIQLRLKINVTEARRDRTLKELSGSCNRHPPPPRPKSRYDRGFIESDSSRALPASVAWPAKALCRPSQHLPPRSCSPSGGRRYTPRMQASTKTFLIPAAPPCWPRAWPQGSRPNWACAITAADILSHPSVRQLAKKLGGTDAALDRGASDQRAAMQRRAFSAKRPTR